MDIGTPEILIVVAVILLLFGATKLPTFARSLGRSMRIFKSEIKGIDKDDEPAEKPAPQPQPQAEAPKELAATASPPADAEAPADQQAAREPVAEKQ
ncbi:MAG TPA: Sec-independent protein translocase subunit TatA [Streptosporangiales bacterium]